MVFDLHGSHFADMSQSNLDFTLTTNAPMAFGLGSVLNIFKEVRVIASNGREISRVQKSNLLNYNLMYAKKGNDFRLNMGGSLRFDSGVGVDTVRHFSVPLSILTPFFATKQLLPPRLTEGLRIEITLEQPNVAFVETVASYTLTSPIFTIDSYELNNQVNVILGQMSPLVYEFETWKHTQSAMDGAETSLDVVNNHALANALEAMLIPRKYSTSVSGSDNSFSSQFELKEGDSYIWRWGSVLMPQNRIEHNADWYNQMLYVNNQLNSDSHKNFGLSYDNYIGEDPAVDGFATAVVQLRRSNILEKSGLELSNQNELQCSVKFAVPENRIIDMYVKHLARVVLDGDDVRIEE